MTDYPSNLVPLPYFGWSERPRELPLDVEECRTALWLHRGNVTKAAARLKVDPGRLRRFVLTSPVLMREQTEAREQMVDRAEEIIYEALHDDTDSTRRDGAAKFLLNAAFAAERGFAPRKPQTVINNTGPLVFGWAGDPGFETVGADDMRRTHTDHSKTIEPSAEDAEAIERAKAG